MSFCRDKAFRQRINLFAGFMMFWFVAIIVRLFWWQVVQHEEIKREVMDLHRSTEEIPALRGMVLDAKGRTLALSRLEPDIFLDPSTVEDVPVLVKALADALGKDQKWQKSQTRDINRKKALGKSRYHKIANRVPEPVCAGLKAKDFEGLYFKDKVQRTYPNRWNSSQVIGFINANQDKEGVESAFDNYLKGRPGRREFNKDGHGRKNVLDEVVLREPLEGADVHLTIDANIQFFVEDSIRLAIDRTQARNITAIVIDPNTGAILAMANMPDFNPNMFSKAGLRERRNRAVTDLYDPGSSFKMITVAAALDSKSISIDQKFYSKEGPVKVFDRTIRNFKPFGMLGVDQILWHSSNAGVIQVALTMSPSTFYDYISRFGFGRRTGISLPAESKGILNPLADWQPSSRYFLAMGHEISATPLQMLVASCAIANGGLLVKPYIGRRVVYADGTEEDLRPPPPKRILKENTARMVAHALEGVVKVGTAKSAAIPGVDVFGKTGTAQRIIGKSYSADKYNSSFVGFFPAQAPQYGMIVVVHDPRGAKVHGGDVAAPVFSEIGRKILQYDHEVLPGAQWLVETRTPDWSARLAEQPETSGQMPDLTGLGLRNLLYKTKKLGIKVVIRGNGRVVRQSPMAGEHIPKNRRCIVELKEG